MFHTDTPVGLGAGAMSPTVSVVIPTLNEERNLKAVFAALPPDVFEIVLVDGWSTDGTIEEAKRLRPDIRVVLQTGRGKGNAWRAGSTPAPVRSS